MAAAPFVAKLVERKDLAQDIYEVTFQMLEPRELIYDAGNFLMVKVEDGIAPVVMRAYTFASSDFSKTIFKLCFKIFRDEYGRPGRGSGYLASIPIGTVVSFFGPTGVGEFATEITSQKPLWLLSTGTGVAPLKALAEKLTYAKSPRQIYLILGVSFVEEKFYEANFAELKLQNPNFDYQICVSRPPEHYTGCSGRIPSVLDRLEIPREAEFKLCGSVPSVQGIRAKLISLGFAATSIDGGGFGVA